MEWKGALDDLILEGHPLRFIWTVLLSIDFSALEASYRWVPGGPGRPPYHPRLLVALWVYAMTQGMETAAEIVRACSQRNDFIWLCGDLKPSDQTLLNLLDKGEELNSILIAVLKAMHQEGLIDLSLILEDGTKMRANASRRSFLTEEKIGNRIDELKERLKQKSREISSKPEPDRKDHAQLYSIQEQLRRSERALQELRERGSSQPKRSSADSNLTPMEDGGDKTLKSQEETTTPTEESGTKAKKPKERGPQASVTDPDAKFMRATSVKQWQPSLNADICVTQDGIIVSVILTKQPTDYPNFEPSLTNVFTTFGRHPESWAADGHYGTYHNLQLAHEAQITLYAPPPTKSRYKSHDQSHGTDGSTPVRRPGQRFTLDDFQYDRERDVYTCPNHQELRFIGVYPIKKGGEDAHRLYGHAKCADCPLRSQCTKSDTERRLRIRTTVSASTDDAKGLPLNDDPSHPVNLMKALEARMDDAGDEMMQVRQQTVEPANAHLKQHGLGRFHVRGLKRCTTALMLACLAHNLMKWNVRRAAYAMKLSA